MGGPAAPAEIGRRIEFRYRGHPYALHVYQLGPTTYRVATTTSLVDVGVERLGDVERRVILPGRRHRVLSTLVGPVHTVEVEGVTHTIARDEGGVVRSPTPAVIVSVAVAPGDKVAVGDPLAVLESMKMETAVRATFPGRVRSVAVGPNVQVDAGDPLLQLEPLITDDESTAAAPVDLGFGTGSSGPGGTFEAVQAYLLGYDLDPATMGQIEQGDDPWGPLAVDDPERLRGEDEILQLFADVCTLSRRQPDPADEMAGERVRAPEEHLLTCLRTYETGGEGLPPAFLDRLLRVLRRHGLDGLAPTTEVEDALLRLYRSQQRLDEMLPAIAAILDRRLAHREELLDRAGAEQRELLDHLVASTAGRYAGLMDLARDVRFQFFEQPVLARAQAEVYAEMDGHIEALAAGADPAGWAAHMDALIACPQPLRPELLRWFQEGDARERDLALEVAARRYYRIRDLEDLEVVEVDGTRLAVADYAHAGARFHLMVAYAPAGELDALAARWPGTWPGRGRAAARRRRPPVAGGRARRRGRPRRAAAARAGVGRLRPAGAPDRRHHHRRAARAAAGRHLPLLLPVGRRRPRPGRGPALPEPAPDAGQAARPRPAAPVQHHPARLGRGRVPVPRRRPRQPA